jgi:Flp pilus assembly protein TadB
MASIALPFVAALAAAAALTGVALVVAGLQKVPASAPRPRRSLRIPTHAEIRRMLGPGHEATRYRMLAGLGLGLGLVIALLTGWLIALIIAPAALAGIPMLVARGRGRHTIDRIEGLEEWTRSLAGVLGAGSGLEQAIQATLSRSTPAAIRPEVSTLVVRLRNRWSTREALRSFADDIDDATGDAVVAGLLLASERRGQGLGRMLEDIADRAAEDVRNRRRIEADLERPRTTARWVTLITVSVLVLMVLFRGDYIAPYGTVLGQMLLLVLLSAYVAALLWMRQLAQGRPRPRLLNATTRPGGAG